MWAENLALSNFLRRLRLTTEDVVVCTAPWFWPAVSTCKAGRRLVDLGDDWEIMLPHRQDLIARLHKRICVEADAVMVASPVLADKLTNLHNREIATIRNGTHVQRVDVATPVQRQRMAMVGTLSERIDFGTLNEVARLMPTWKIDLFGECKFPGLGDRMSPAMTATLAENDNVAYHGVLEPSERTAKLRTFEALIILHNDRFGAGQDSMKLYDYAASGRPIVCTQPSLVGAAQRPPGVVSVTNAADFARAVADAATEPREWRDKREAWALEQDWSIRWRDWSRHLEGREPDLQGHLVEGSRSGYDFEEKMISTHGRRGSH